MNIDVEELVCFAYEQSNKIITTMMCNNYGEKDIQHINNVFPNLLIEFLLEDQQKLSIRRKALDMHTNVLVAKMELAARIWRSGSDLETRGKAVQDVLDLLRMSLIKKAVLTYEKQMQESLNMAFSSSDNAHTRKVKL